MLKAIQESQLTDNHLYVDEIHFFKVKDLIEQIEKYIEVQVVYVMDDHPNDKVKLYVFEEDKLKRAYNCGFIQGIMQNK